MYETKPTSAAFVMEQTAFNDNIKVTKVVDKPGLHYVKFPARLQTYNVFNRNNRNYRLEPMKQSWNAPHIQELEARGDFMGECGHPQSEDPKRIVTIDPKYVCHRIVNHWFQGNSVYGNIETLNDEMYGKQFMMHVLQNCTASFSLRALVPLTSVGNKKFEIKAPGHIICIDRVILPSHPDAYQTDGTVEMITSESTQAIPMKITNNSKPSIDNSSKDKIVQVKEAAFLDYLTESNTDISSIIDQFEIAAESISLDSNKKNIIIREAAQKDGSRMTAIVSLDEFARNEISKMYSKL